MITSVRRARDEVTAGILGVATPSTLDHTSRLEPVNPVLDGGVF
jgi:hypothetical protein